MKPRSRTLTTSRLVLRPFTVADREEHRRMYERPEVTRFLADGPFLGDEAARRSRMAVDLFTQHWAKHGFGVWAITDRASGKLIGQCGLKYLPGSPEVELLYALDAPCWGRGLATEAGEAALDYGFKVVGLDRIVAVTRPEHRASRRVMEKLGMTYEGKLVVLGIDAVCYAISRGQFRIQPAWSRRTRS